MASGALPVKQAVLFLGGQLTAAFTILLTFNPYSIVLGASSLVVVGIYPRTFSLGIGSVIPTKRCPVQS